MFKINKGNILHFLTVKMLPLSTITCMLKGKSFTQLSKEERIKIEVLLQEGRSVRFIALTLNRSASTISREISRNGPKKYGAGRAQEFTTRRHRQKMKHCVFDQSMKDFIVQKLCITKWSPELISAEGKDWRSDFISAEWIYQWIWAMKFSMCKSHQKYQGLYKYLKNCSRHRKRGHKRTRRGNIIGRTWIEERPAPANNRSRQGDLEADIMLGKDRQPGLLVALDRRTRKTWIRKLKVKDAGYVMKKLEQICKQIGDVKTITLDNDQSFAEHYRLEKHGIKTFFTHPYSSQEKGSVENRIGLIRMFFPKKTNFKQVNYQEVKAVQKMINQRPMRMFNYRSPNEIHIS